MSENPQKFRQEAGFKSIRQLNEPSTRHPALMTFTDMPFWSHVPLNKTNVRFKEVICWTRLHLSVPHRFDASGKGKGLDGRVEKADDSGYVGNYKGEGTYDKKH